MAGVDVSRLFDRVAEAARSAGVFGGVRLEGDRLVCDAAASAEPAEYRLEREGDAVWVSLVMRDRWLSESVEADLMHSGDKLEELLDEELAELGFEAPTGGLPSYQHFRSEDMLFTFRSEVPLEGKDEASAVRTATQWLLGYEACFRQLGDMEADGDDD
ncbi:MAG: hypothetical protein ACTS22_00375 [Phycisphaerales bacterium]